MTPDDYEIAALAFEAATAYSRAENPGHTCEMRPEAVKDCAGCQWVQDQSQER